MQSHITPDRIANSIQQSSSEYNAFILVEGNFDVKFYSKYFSNKKIKLTQTFGKYKQRDVHKILTSRGFKSFFGIRDSDFLMLPGNHKFDSQYNESIFTTDCHDSEIMAVSLGAFNELMLNCFGEELINNFEKDYFNIVDKLMTTISDIGYLRLANKKHNLGLKFKPEQQDGNGIKYSKFFDSKKCLINTDEMMNYISAYSRSLRTTPKSIEFIKDKFLEEKKTSQNLFHLNNGHDFCGCACAFIKDNFKPLMNNLKDEDALQLSIAISFNQSHFVQTKLYSKTSNWLISNGI